MFERTKALCDSFIEKGIPGFDIAVYRKGECVLRYANGYSDAENRTPVTGRERYNIYSCSKPITCTAALQLWEKGAFGLEDELSAYLPEFAEMTVKTAEGIRPAERPIRIRHLFEMTAGFSYDLNSPSLKQARLDTDGRCPTRETVKYLAKEPLLFEPGAQWHYSLCHDVLAALVEVVSGEKFELYVKKHIFDPLGMDRSTFLLPEEERDGLAGQYKFDADGHRFNCGKRNVYMLGSEYASGGAGCVSTVDDYMRFLEATRKGDVLLKKETTALMATARLTPEQQATYNKRESYGYGLGIRTPREGSIYTDFGWGGAAGAYLAVDPAEDLTMFYAQQVLSSPNHSLRSLTYLYAAADAAPRPEYEAVIAEIKRA